MEISKTRHKDTPLTREERLQMFQANGLEELKAEWRRLDVYKQESQRFPQKILTDLDQWRSKVR